MRRLLEIVEKNEVTHHTPKQVEPALH